MMNKDLILREYLAVERTTMANQRTLLSFIRTGLYFLVAGSTLGELIHSMFWDYMAIPLVIIGIIIMIIGGIVYAYNKKKINKSKKQIGNTRSDFIQALNLDPEE